MTPANAPKLSRLGQTFVNGMGLGMASEMGLVVDGMGQEMRKIGLGIFLRDWDDCLGLSRIGWGRTKWDWGLRGIELG